MSLYQLRIGTIEYHPYDSFMEYLNNVMMSPLRKVIDSILDN